MGTYRETLDYFEWMKICHPERMYVFHRAVTGYGDLHLPAILAGEEMIRMLCGCILTTTYFRLSLG